VEAVKMQHMKIIQDGNKFSVVDQFGFVKITLSTEAQCQAYIDDNVDPETDE
jgi:hypothetical protein